MPSRVTWTSVALDEHRAMGRHLPDRICPTALRLSRWSLPVVDSASAVAAAVVTSNFPVGEGDVEWMSATSSGENDFRLPAGDGISRATASSCPVEITGRYMSAATTKEGQTGPTVTVIAMPIVHDGRLFHQRQKAGRRMMLPKARRRLSLQHRLPK